MHRDLEMLKEILEITNDEDVPKESSLYMAMHYQFKGKLAARHLDVEGCLEAYRICEEIFMSSAKGERSLLMQSYYQFAIDDISELGIEAKANQLNKEYKQTLQKFYNKDNLFYIAYTIDIVA